MGVEAQRRRQLEQITTQGHVPFMKAREQTLQTYCSPVLVNNDGGPMVQETTVIQDHPTNPSISTKHWSLDFLLKQSPNFQPVRRIKAQDLGLQRRIDQYESDKDAHPLIIEGWQHHESWPGEMFNIDWFERHGPNTLSVRNMHNRLDKDIPLSQFINTSRVSSVYVEPHETERLYGKDVECPKQWAEWLNSGGVLPQCLVPHGPNDLMLNSSLSAGVETLMCYLGIGDTFTPSHKDLCASSGQNLMCYTERGGSSFWFMTGGSSSFKVAEFFHTLGQEVDHENYVIDIETLAKAPFPVYVAEQKLGDLVLVPPRSCHQVVNNGGLTLKTSWSRMTLRGLEVAYHFELPLYRRVCRPEVYRIKETVQHALRTFTTELQSNSTATLRTPSKVAHDLNTTLRLFDAVLVEEAAPQKMKISVLSESNGEEDDRFTCDFCSGDIFQSFFECRDCVAGDRTADLGSGFIVCPGCYIEGRSCRCEIMEPVQRHSFGSFVELRKEAVRALQKFQQSSEPAHPSIESILKRGDGAFRAACRLRSHRKDHNRTCLPVRNSQSHSVPSTAALYCKNCHHSRCFFHLLTQQKLHAHDALVAPANDYHNLHMNSHNAYLAASNRRFLSQRHGTPPQEPNIMRAYFSLNFRKCKPANYRYMKAGWYDIIIKEAPPVSNETLNTCGSSSSLLLDGCPIHTSSPLSTLPDDDDESGVEEQPQTTTVSEPSPISRSQPFVLVPPAPYNIRTARIIRAPTPPPLHELQPFDDQLGHLILPDNAPTIFPISPMPSIMSEAQPPVQQSLRFRKGPGPDRAQSLTVGFNVAASGHTPPRDSESPVYPHNEIFGFAEGSSTKYLEDASTETSSTTQMSEDRERIEMLEARAASWSQEKETLHRHIAALQSQVAAGMTVQPQQIVSSPLDPHWMEKAKILFECLAHVPLLPDIPLVPVKPQYLRQQRDLGRQWGMNYQRSQLVNDPLQYSNMRPDRYQHRRPQPHIRQPQFGNYVVNRYEYHPTTGGRPDRARQQRPFVGPYSPQLQRPSTSTYNLRPSKLSPERRRNNGTRRRSRFDEQWQPTPKANETPTPSIQVEVPRPVDKLNFHSNVARPDPPEQGRSSEVPSEDANQQQATPDLNSADDGHEMDTVCASSPDVDMRPPPKPIETSDQDWEDDYEQLDDEQASPQSNAPVTPAEANATSTVRQTGAGSEDDPMPGMTERSTWKSQPSFEDNPWA